MLKYKHKKNITLIYQECFLKNYLSNDIVIEYINMENIFCTVVTKMEIVYCIDKGIFFLCKRNVKNQRLFFYERNYLCTS